MSLLSALARAYDRLPDAPPYGFSTEKIGFCVVLNPDGSVAEVVDLRDTDKKRSPRMVRVPQPWKKASGIKPNFLWENTSYALGVTAGDDKRTAQERAAFCERHEKWLADTDEPGLIALKKFNHQWKPEQFKSGIWPTEMLDQAVVFALAGSHRQGFLHDSAVAGAMWERIKLAEALPDSRCLVTGDTGPIARLHPSIKGVWGAQSSGASIVSFNDDAYESYGHKQGDNAPVSEAAAFAYTTALNRFLEKDSGHRIQIGDASTVFWADCQDATVAEEADFWAACMLGSPAKSGTEEKLLEAKIHSSLKMMRDGKPLKQIAPHLDLGVRMHLLGLAPNAARLSVRFYWEDSFGTLARNYAAYLRDIALEPAPERPVFSIRSAVLRSAPAEVQNGKVKYDGDRVSPLLAGELTRAILTGARFPRSLLSLLLLRIRSDHVLDRIRISLIKGLILRDMRLEQRLPKRPDGTPMEDYLMRPDPDDLCPARLLGRLFALIEKAQLAALGDQINATVKDKFLSAAASTPGRVFPGLLMNAENHHLKRLRNGHSDADWIKDASHARAVGAGLNRDIGTLWAGLQNAAPAQHSSEEQGLFLVGYYQERYAKHGEADEVSAPADHDSEE
ncbi:MAG: type I-C CRISPR-associated protein Cas8c/Csd1 [Rhodobacteraceae bacterium GWE1_64_9]|nr:MAG: type I-C CRISPR-associated protein Cas8c/Csd1 [Rhodobacteraceae bacterium GWE1_64_9]OHC47626.1 MAG: type I-C CRISPR-associated protein Cas8c/Csd1 [Rhodobacteraceae bacterium GWF1_65_7]HBD91071.1 type I-C CRISPR-associated protein Cas8c/Csd1 [Gemmobacter sp.]HBU14327.1 type I-C CRISPR-associated protein Cas8c/Csd1 [Gemmobacter sp.]